MRGSTAAGMALVIGWIVGCGGRSTTRLENTIGLCSDDVDNDRDGNVDCADQNCWVFVICATADGGPDSDGDVDTDTDSDTDGDADFVSGCDGGEWVVEVVESEGYAGAGPSIAVADDGSVHISHYGNTDPSRQVRYVTNASGDWVGERVMMISPFGYSGNFTSLALASDGTVRIAFEMFGAFASGALGFASNESGIWENEDADPAGATYAPSLVLDADDDAHVSYRRLVSLGGGAGRVDARYATDASGEWLAEDVLLNVWGETSIVLDDDSFAHIAICGDTEADEMVRYATNASGEWVLEDIEAGAGNEFWFCAIALDTSGSPEVLYDGIFDDIHHATRGGAGWGTDIIDEVDTYALGDFRIDPHGGRHVVYAAPAGSEGVRYMLDTGAGWAAEVVDDLDAHTYDMAIAIDAEGAPHVAYGDPVTSDLMYASCR